MHLITSFCTYFKQLKRILAMTGISVLCLSTISTYAQNAPIVKMSFQERLLMSLGLYHFHNVDQLSQNDIFNKGQLLLTDLNKILGSAKREKVIAHSLEEYIKLSAAFWPESGSLDADITYLKNTPQTLYDIEFKDEATKQSVLAYQNLRQQKLSELKGQIPFPLDPANLNESLKTTSVSGASSDKSQSVIQNSDLYSQKISELFKTQFAGVNNPLIKNLLTIFLSEYFKSTSSLQKANIIANYFGDRIDFDNLRLLEVALMSSGPEVQKMIQTLARENSLPEQLKPLFEKFESAIRPVPFWQIQEILKKSTFPFEVLSIEPIPLGTGSIAQVHKGKIKFKNKKEPVTVVFRFIKPNLDKIVAEEYRLLEIIAPVVDAHPDIENKGFPSLVDLLEQVHDMITNDLKQKTTARKQKTARSTYIEKGFYVPQVWLANEEVPLVMVQEFIPGTKISKLTPRQQKYYMEKLVKLWLEEVFFESGFFHADLHQGNFLFLAKQRLLSILDFGMTGQLTRDHQNLLLSFALALKIAKPESLAEIVWDMSTITKNTISKEDFTVAIEEKLNRIKSGQEKQADLKYWTMWIMKQGIQFKPPILKFLRGSILLVQQLKSIKNSKSMFQLATEVALEHPISSMRGLLHPSISILDLARIAWEGKILGGAEAKNVKEDPTAESLKKTQTIKCEQIFR